MNTPIRVSTLVATVLSALLYHGAATASEGFPGLQDTGAPPLSLTDLFGKTHDITRLHGELVIVNFWASWCPPCLAEMPSLQRLMNLMRGRPLRILAVNFKESKSTVWRFRKLLNMQFPLLLDDKGHTSRAWNVDIFPTSFLVDAQGRIRHVLKGAVEWDSGKTLDLLESLMPDNQQARPATFTQLSP